MDVVTAFFPESNPKGVLRLRPCLVTRVLQNSETGQFACEVAFGTKNLKLTQRQGVDLIIQNSSDITGMGLSVATRFDLDPEKRAILLWNDEYFGCWTGKSSPKLCSLPLEYQKEFAFLIMRRMGT
jgi:hypothetical protein